MTKDLVCAIEDQRVVLERDEAPIVAPWSRRSPPNQTVRIEMRVVAEPPVNWKGYIEERTAAKSLLPKLL